MRTWKRALVTGASSGIGREIARQLVERGSQKVFLVSRNVSEMEETAKTAPDKMELMPADLSKKKDVASISDFLKKEPIDLLVNNAGLSNFKRFDEQSKDSVEQLLAVNIHALTMLCHSVIPKMLDAGSGDILNVSSVGGDIPLPHEALYAATKSFVTSFSQGIRGELIGKGVNVTALLPGLVRTNLFDVAGSRASVSGMPNFMWMNPEDVALIALRATSNRKPIVVSGAFNKTMIGMMGVMPRPIKRGFALRAQAGRKKYHRKQEA